MMNAQNLLNLLENYYPKDSEEISYKERMISFAKKDINCFERSNQSGHFTASSLLLNKDKDKALLMHHKKLDMWLQLGGHCDGDNICMRVAIKEACEESGIKSIKPFDNNIFDIDIHFIPDFKGVKGHYHYDVRFLLFCQKDEPVQVNRESKSLIWINKDDIKLINDPKGCDGSRTENLPLKNLNKSVVRMLNKWAAI